MVLALMVGCSPRVIRVTDTTWCERYPVITTSRMDSVETKRQVLEFDLKRDFDCKSVGGAYW